MVFCPTVISVREPDYFYVMVCIQNFDKQFELKGGSFNFTCQSQFISH